MKLENIKSNKNFNNEEAIRLARENNDQKLKDEIIRNNIPLVYKTVDSWIRRGSTDDRDDLIGLGMFALVKAYNTYRFDKNAKFSTYLCNVIWQQLMAHVRQKEMICRSKYSTVSLQGVIVEDEKGYRDVKYEDIVPDDYDLLESVENKVYADHIGELIDSGLLTKAERIVVRKYILENKELVEIGNELGISRQAAQQSFKKGLKKLAEVVSF